VCVGRCASDNPKVNAIVLLKGQVDKEG